jgi:hypothetical protein
MKKFAPAILFTIFAFSMIVVVLRFAPIGDPHLPGYAGFDHSDNTEKEISEMTKKEVIQYADSVALHYNRHSPGDTGALDIITAIIFDYRGYDTLIEATVLFTAMIGVLSIIGTKRN